MLEKQLELESQMQDLGAEKYLKSIDPKNDFDSGHMQIIISKIIDPFSDEIKDEIDVIKDRYNRGYKLPLHCLSECVAYINKDKNSPLITSHQISFIVCRILFNSIRHNQHKMVALAMDIGTTINSNLIIEDRLSDGCAFRVGVALIDLFCSRFSELVHYKYEFFNNKSKNKEYIVSPSEELITFLDDKIDAISDIMMVMFPMVHVPCDWDSKGQGGGFYSEDLKTSIIKRKRVGELTFINEMIASSVNVIQSTPWQINNPMVEIVSNLNKTKPSTLKKLYPLNVPDNDPKPFELKYMDMSDKQKKVHQKWSRDSKRNDTAREAKKSIEIARYSAMNQAKKFENDIIYFPHDLDYRNRIYNKCMTGLNTQGSDGQKGLMQFANAKPVTTDSGVRWMSINLANLVGHDKLRLDERYAWTVNNEALIRDVVKNPYKCTLWHDFDKPLQGLAAAMDYVKWLDDKESPVNTHVQLDGRCNACQHLASITRDEIVAPHVGLVETLEGGDLYQYVNDGVVDHITNIGGNLATEWLTSGLMGRNIAKVPVMTRSYGAKLYGIKEGIQTFIEDANKADHFNDYFKSGNWLGEKIWHSMDITLEREMAFMRWVQTCAGILASANLPMIWTNPVGMKCIQSPFVTKSKTIQTKINGNRIDYKIQTPTDIINKAKSMSSSAPNLIHSADASHLILTTSGCIQQGISDYSFVHDSFGAHPDDASNLLLQAKRSWVKMYSKNWMEMWYQNWVQQLGSSDLPHYSEFVKMGNLDVKSVMKSDFFFS